MSPPVNPAPKIVPFNFEISIDLIISFLRSEPAGTVEFAPDGSQFAVLGGGDGIPIFDVASEKQVWISSRCENQFGRMVARSNAHPR